MKHQPYHEFRESGLTMKPARRMMLGLLMMLVAQGTCWGQMIVAHRGSSDDAPENTLAAFRLAWQQQSDGIEGDFYLTADKRIVCIHDRDTERTGSGQKLSVESSTLEQLRQKEYGSWKAAKFEGETLPTLAEVFETIPAGKTFVIELKSKGEIATVVADELERLPTEKIRLLVITFDLETARLCKSLMPTTPTHWLTRFEEASTENGYRPSAEEIARRVREAGLDGVGMQGDRKVIDAEFIRRLSAAGCPEFHVWTIDSVDDARYFQALGAIGITTNRPAVIKPAIRPDPATP